MKQNIFKNLTSDQLLAISEIKFVLHKEFTGTTQEEAEVFINKWGKKASRGTGKVNKYL